MAATTQAPRAINERVIRWSELRLPDPTRPGELAKWPIDGPFALRKYYRIEGTDAVVEIAHIDKRRDDGTLEGCLNCGHAGLVRRAEVNWAPIVLLAIVGLGLAYWTFGLSALITAYPIWFLWASGERIDHCPNCGAEFVNFCEGPRP
ncbi:MAG: hypothetical protein AAFU73_08560 [Planctomycetota bacterium]